eukprot:CAMPEP_0176078398 /NCGR_PEP_ID=MMETSP0120_2-20121206/39205_1 /TAXON_ID=160619 /ORGANISM="Kryptoperidinium foliaceum, Strain CCMP 1326" /LENGTH=426 /DNA_ID=CAMNT_0017412143 /DNA_START=33 /DNA_END=1311 /DNA_ORIENTATION=-
MAPMKRPAAAAAGGREKAAKSAKNLELEALRDAVLEESEAFPPVVRSMLAGALETSLFVLKDERHKSQEEIVGMVGEVIASLRDDRQKAKDAIAARLASSDAERATRKARGDSTRAACGERVAAATAAKGALAEASRGVGAAKAALADAKAEQRSGDEGLVAAAAKKQQLEELLAGDYAALKRGEAANAVKSAKAVIKVGQAFDVEGALLESAEVALTKAPGERGTFDGAVLEQFEGEVASRVAALTAELAVGEPGREERAAKVSSAEQEMAAAGAKLLECKTALDEAQAAVESAEAEREAAEKAESDLAPELQAMEGELDAASASLEHAENTLTMFTRLRDRTTADEAAPEAPAAEAPATVNDDADVEPTAAEAEADMVDRLRGRPPKGGGAAPRGKFVGSPLSAMLGSLHAGVCPRMHEPLLNG